MFIIIFLYKIQYLIVCIRHELVNEGTNENNRRRAINERPIENASHKTNPRSCNCHRLKYTALTFIHRYTVSEPPSIFPRHITLTTMMERIHRLFLCMAAVTVVSRCTARIRTTHAQNCSSIATPIVIRGKKFFNKLTGSYVPIKGVNYYPRPNTGNLTRTNSIDFFTEEFRDIWERDIEYFKQLNVNVVGLYAVAPGQKHDGFMCALQAANMYVIVGLSADCEDCSIDKETLPPACYPAALKQRGQFIISEFARYDNVLAFSAGNEASLNTNTSLSNAPCQKQFIRDMRAYIDSCAKTIRPIPVGLAFADNDRDDNALYYGCRSNKSDTLENAEYVGINAYQHCNGNSNDLPGYEKMLSDFTNYSLPMPAVISEFGCIDPSFPTIDGYAGQRNFLDVDALFTQRYRNTFVGGLVFEYSTELINSESPYPYVTYGNGNFGIGYFTPENCNDQTVPCVYQPFPQFEILATKYAAADVSDEPNLDDYVVTDTSYPQCPSQFPALSTLTWPGASTEDLACPNFVYVECPNVPTECENLGIASILTPQPIAPTTISPTKSPTTTIEAPSGKPVSGPTATEDKPTRRPVASPTDGSLPTTTPTLRPITAPTSSSTKFDGMSHKSIFTLLSVLCISAIWI